MKRHFEDLQLGSIELFCLAAEASSFTAAAQVARVTPAAVSRSISRLEERLGSRLFVRTTRSIRLTDSGRTFFEQCRQALTQLVEAQQEVMGAQSVPSGLLRISIPTPYAHHRLLPLLPKFRALYPQVTVDVHISNRNIDFVAEEYDLAVRVRAQPNSSLIARRLKTPNGWWSPHRLTCNVPASHRRWSTCLLTNASSTNCRATAGASPGCSRSTAKRRSLRGRRGTAVPTMCLAA